jgi:Na+-driven multidrug efflux pump
VYLFGFWMLEIPMAYVLAIPAGWQSKGAFWSIVISEGAIAAISILLFKRGRWKLQKI